MESRAKRWRGEKKRWNEGIWGRRKKLVGQAKRSKIPPNNRSSRKRKERKLRKGNNHKMF